MQPTKKVVDVYDIFDETDEESSPSEDEPPPAQPAPPLLAPIIDMARENNLIYLDVRERFKNEEIFQETALFSAPVSTTNTMEGFISNIKFMEEDLIKIVKPSANIVVMCCNYGKEIYGGYGEPVKVKSNNRGRKPKEKKKKMRKKQGLGTSFNSQLTFVVKSALEPVINDKVSPSAKVYKFKIFRTGKLQLPGVQQSSIDDVIQCTRYIIDALNDVLYDGEPVAQLVNINPVMKNHKFVVKIPPTHIINLTLLKKMLDEERVACAPGAPPHPAVYNVKYTRQDTKLSVKFSTPIFKKPHKRTRINIFMRGKINILGGFDNEASRAICSYLHWLFDVFGDQIIQSESRLEPAPKPEISLGLSEEDLAAFLADIEGA